MQHRRSLRVARWPLTLLAAAALVRAPALAGVVDSPLPPPFTQHVFTVPGVVNPGGLDAYFVCTNLDGVAVTVGVEIFGPPGGGPMNDAAATSLNVAVGATVMFGTGAAFGLVIDSNLGSGSFSKGSARILSTSKKIACSAFVADPGNAPPTSMVQLTIIKGTKQKASN